MHPIALLLSAVVASAYAKTIVVTVGGNTTEDAGAVFSPQSVEAKEGDILFFNFTQGNHTATQSTFASPCVPAHITNSTVNGFDSGPRDTVGGKAVTSLQVTIDDANTTLWFFDYNTCAQGGVGGANINESSWETLDGFQRNAQRLNGSDSTDYSTSSSSPTGTSASTTPRATSAASSSTHAVMWGAASVVPILAMLAAISF